MTIMPLDSAGQKVIVVEDDSDLLHALRFSEGWPVVSYPTAEALLAGEPLPDAGCLVFDHVLPGTSGLDLLSQLRARGTTLPAIIITTNPTVQTRRRAAERGASIVEKPLFGGTLTDAIRQALSTKA